MADLELHGWPTPNGQRITMFLEEASEPYELKLVNIDAGDQLGSRRGMAAPPSNAAPS
jgi:GSH-dependent disulfide-bond oxidoreductase